MTSKQIVATMEMLSSAYDGIQQVTIQATETNVSVFSESLRKLKIVYRTLDEINRSIEEGNKDGRVSEAE